VSEDWVRVAAVGDVSSNSGIRVTIGTKSIALFLVDEAYYAVQNNCPHRGAPLFCSDIDDQSVICIEHAWRFSLVDGKCFSMGPESALMTWDVKVDGDDIYLSRLARMPEDA
jgi:nitrite reductase/ring-hydroxylating ferredoxin subunit